MLRLIGLLSYVYHNPLPSVADTPHFQLLAKATQILLIRHVVRWTKTNGQLLAGSSILVLVSVSAQSQTGQQNK